MIFPLLVPIKIIKEAKHFEPEAKQRDMFGDGRAVKRIVDILAGSRYKW